MGIMEKKMETTIVHYWKRSQEPGHRKDNAHDPSFAGLGFRVKPNS